MASKARSRSFLTIDAVGTQEMVAAFKWLERTGVQEQIIAPTLEAGADILEGAVARSVPVLTGDLKGTLRTFVSKTRARVVIGDARNIQAKYLEFGTKKMPAQPFMRPALDSNRRRIEAIAVKHMNDALARLAKGGRVFSTGGRGRFKRSKAA